MSASEEVPVRQDNYAVFCEMLRHPSARPLIVRIRNFVTKFPENLPRKDAAEMVSKFLTDAEEYMFSDIVVFQAEADAAGRQAAAEGMEKFLISRLHSNIFAADPVDVVEDERLEKHISGLSWLELPHLGIPKIESSLLPQAKEELQQIDNYKAPADKLICVMNTCKIINDMLRRTHAEAGTARPLSADDFLPLLIYTLILANPPRFHSNTEFIAGFRHPSRLQGEEDYFVTCLLSAKEFVKEVSHKALEIGEAEYHKRYDAALIKAGYFVEADFAADFDDNAAAGLVTAHVQDDQTVDCDRIVSETPDKESAAEPLADSCDEPRLAVEPVCLLDLSSDAPSDPSGYVAVSNPQEPPEEPTAPGQAEPEAKPEELSLEKRLRELAMDSPRSCHSLVDLATPPATAVC